MRGDIIHIENESTSSYVSIPSSHFSLLPPEDFSLSQSFFGLESAKFQGQIRLKELKGQSFRSKIRAFSPGVIPEQDVHKREALLINGFQARFICFAQENPTLMTSVSERMINMVLHLGDERFLALLMASYPIKWHAQIGQSVENCLKSVIYDPMRSPMQSTFHEQVSFELNATPAGLKLADFNSQFKEIGLVHTLVFTTDGKDLASTDHIHRLIVMEKTWPGTQVALEFLPGFQNNFFSSYEPMDNQKVSIDGLEGYESWAIETANDSQDDRKLAYQLLLFDKDRHFEIRAWAPDTEIGRLRAFQEVSRSFRLR